MSKRRLSRRQNWRVKKIQQERSLRAEKKTRQSEEQLVGGQLGAEQKGLIVAHYGGEVEVEALEGALRGRTQRAHLRANLEPLVTGDTVAWCPGQTTGVVVARFDRSTELCRPDNRGQLRPVAANIDYIIVVVAIVPPPHAYFIDRYLVAAENQGITPILLLNKVDLLESAPESALGLLLDTYRSIGYRVVSTSTQERTGLEALRQILAGHTSVFVGQSGVGKSSIINALLPAANIQVGAISSATGKGKHTTTSARLFHIPGGGELIDSPGIRDFGLWHLDPAGIAYGFREFRPLLGHCKFRDCSHQGDPGCALVEGIDNGAIEPRRYASFCHLLGSLASG